MRKPFIIIFLSLFLVGFLDGGKIKLYLDDTRTEFIMVDKQNCSVHKTEERGITVGFKVSNFFFKAGPEVTFSKKAGIAWDEAVQAFIARYEELCALFNTGSLTKKEYDTRLKELEMLQQEALEVENKMKEEVRRRSSQAFSDLEREVGGKKEQETEGQDKLVSRITKLAEEIKSGTASKRPDSPIGIMGVPGQKSDEENK